MNTLGENTNETYSNRYLDYFEEKYDGDKLKISLKCLVAGCKQTLSSKSAAIRHLQRNHKDICSVISANKSKIKIINDAKNGIEFEIRVKVNKSQIENAVVDLVTKHALPLRIVEYPAFMKLLQPYQIALKNKGIELNVTKHHIRDLIKERAELIKNTIRSEVKHKMVNVLVDIASRYNRSIFGVNMSYMKDGEVIVRTIGMHSLHMAHTARNLKEMINMNLKQYDIPLKRLFSICSDNGENILKAVAMVDLEYQQQKQLNETENDIDSDINEDFDDESIDGDILDSEFYTNLLNSCRQQFTNEVAYSDLIFGVTCAAHGIHLIISKALTKSNSKQIIVEKCRDLSKKLRTQTFRYILEEKKLNFAIIDVVTRWNSIYAMVRSHFNLIECL